MRWNNVSLAGRHSGGDEMHAGTPLTANSGSPLSQLQAKTETDLMPTRTHQAAFSLSFGCRFRQLRHRGGPLIERRFRQLGHRGGPLMEERATQACPQTTKAYAQADSSHHPHGPGRMDA